MRLSEYVKRIADIGEARAEYRPSTVERLKGAALVLLAHPSGLCRYWNTPGAVDEAREALREGGVLS